MDKVKEIIESDDMFFQKLFGIFGAVFGILLSVLVVSNLPEVEEESTETD